MDITNSHFQGFSFNCHSGMGPGPCRCFWETFGIQAVRRAHFTCSAFPTACLCSSPQKEHLRLGVSPQAKVFFSFSSLTKKQTACIIRPVGAKTKVREHCAPPQISPKPQWPRTQPYSAALSNALSRAQDSFAPRPRPARQKTEKAPTQLRCFAAQHASCRAKVHSRSV